MNARVFISALALLALAGAGAGASAQAIDPDIVEQTEREPTEAGRLPRCPGDPRCGEREGEIVPRQTPRPDP